MLAAVLVAFAGCSSKPKEIDTSKLRKTFESASQTTQTTVQNAVIAIQSEDYSAAVTELKKVAADTKLTPEQQQALKDTLDQLAKKVQEAASKTMDELQKSIPKK